MSNSHHHNNTGQSDGIAMSRIGYLAIKHACDHTARALSAAQAAELFDSTAMIALDRVRSQLRESLQTLQAIKSQARVTA